MGANAQTSVPAFTAGQVLTAAQMTQVNTGIPVFASSTERDAAFGGTGEKTLAEGQMAYLEDTNETQYYDGSAWAAVGQAGGKILQVVSTTKTDTFTASLTSGADTAITGLSATITPSDASSTILVMVDAHMADASDAYARGAIRIYRGATSIGEGTGAGSRTTTFASMSIDQTGTFNMVNIGGTYLDSPATTSATTYTVHAVNAWTTTKTIAVNRSATDANTAIDTRPSSTITLMEVSA